MNGHTSIYSKRWEDHDLGPPSSTCAQDVQPTESERKGKTLRKTGTAILCNVLFNMATMIRVLLLKPRHFFVVTRAVSFLKFLLLNQNLNFWYE